MKDNFQYFIVGAGGMIGSSLASSFKSDTEKVIKADVWKGDADGDSIFLDLASDSSAWILPQRIKTAYICAGITKLDACRNDPDGSFRVNVEGTLKLIEMMIDRGAFVVFLSSNQVYDGTIPHVSAEEPHSPLCEYGRQKAAVEKVLMQIPEHAAIVRLSKVIGPNSIFSLWAKNLISNQAIYPFTDMVVSPVDLNTVISVLKAVGKFQLGGIWQISGEQDISYCEAAYWGGNILEVDIRIIQPCSINDVEIDLEVNPPNTTMDTSRIVEELCIKTICVEKIVKNAFIMMQK